MNDVSKSLRSLTKIEQGEQIAQVAHQKCATMSKSLRSLTKNEWMSESLVFFSWIAHSLILSQKTSDSLRKPMSEFLALRILLKVTDCKALCDVKYSQIKGNGRQFHHIGLSNIVVSKFSNSVAAAAVLLLQQL